MEPVLVLVTQTKARLVEATLQERGKGLRQLGRDQLAVLAMGMGMEVAMEMEMEVEVAMG